MHCTIEMWVTMSQLQVLITFVLFAFVTDEKLIKKDEAVLIHFDGWGPEYDYWCQVDIVELHPVGWCTKNGWELQTPRSE